MPSGVTMTQGFMPGAFAFTSNVAASDTVTIGDFVYTFATDPTGVAFEVDVGTDLDDSIGNLVAAINLSGTDDDEYGAGTTVNPYVTAAADLANDEIDLTGRGAGSWVNAVHLGATSPGANDIAVEATSFGAGANTGQVDGVGILEDFVQGLFDQAQLNSDVYRELAQLTDAAD